MKKTLDLYQSSGFGELFQIIRLWDAPMEDLEKFIPNKGVVIDLGCGDGLLANYIGMSRSKVKVIGIDVNKQRIKEAKKGVKNVTFTQGDILKSKLPQADAIFLVHVLHHLPSKAHQEKLIKDCKSKLKPKGKLLVAEIDYQPFHKYLLTWFVDAIIVPILFEGKFFTTNFYYRSKADWMKLFKKNNLTVASKGADKGKPFSHILVSLNK